MLLNKCDRLLALKYNIYLLDDRTVYSGILSPSRKLLKNSELLFQRSPKVYRVPIIFYDGRIV